MDRIIKRKTPLAAKNRASCRWYEYKHSNGNTYKVQGSWELAFIKWIDEQKLEFRCHDDIIDYEMRGTKRKYYPDFFINKWNQYVDIKAWFFNDSAKFAAIKHCNPYKDIRVLYKKDLKELGITV